ncbi:uncharacterized protein BT62DRAFT_1000056 [Guyanagaster necrorhizus]|uniref:Uncharacterized protein n=1 Tax=Guyanagaster necrorhizus TaxID=856835 RepID=A0A9P7W459_9AGAR|nr:uncharacterized protein BT62DRAFT_1000056 [Guyanagaster necrorhizus MCA 3950]KAG7452312.1 hypothetical protein BT62DRAFT_1000056 [Guyanagaster necrorhizus MCA 3950]
MLSNLNATSARLKARWKLPPDTSDISSFGGSVSLSSPRCSAAARGEKAFIACGSSKQSRKTSVHLTDAWTTHCEMTESIVSSNPPPYDMSEDIPGVGLGSSTPNHGSASSSPGLLPNPAPIVPSWYSQAFHWASMFSFIDCGPEYRYHSRICLFTGSFLLLNI